MDYTAETHTISYSNANEYTQCSAQNSEHSESKLENHILLNPKST
jgi:hypothetical protein